jgi:rubrerythrin
MRLSPLRFRDPRALRTVIARQFLGALLASPRGRAYALTQAGVAESSDEGAIFDHVVKRVDDEKLQQMVKKHAEDEERHAALFFAAADRQGVGRPEIPTSIRVLDILDRRIHLFDRAVETDEDVMESYAVLQVIEERAIEQFSMLEPVLRRFDAESADVLAGIAKDEERHLRYCRAITKRYAPSEAKLASHLTELRHEEALAFREHQQIGLTHVLDQGFLSRRATLFWRAALEILSRRDVLPMTRFSEDAARVGAFSPIAQAA